MKTTFFTILLIFSAFLMVGCESDTADVLILDVLPLPPQGVHSVTGDEQVFVYWNGSHEVDVSGYIVYRADALAGPYSQIGIETQVVDASLPLDLYRYIDNDVFNGETYFYAIASFDASGRESLDLSYEDVFDTPRPEGIVTLYDRFFDSLTAGLILDTTLWITAYDDIDADIFIDSDAQAFYINVAHDGVDLQDMGYTSSFDEIGYAPTDGWSNNGWAELIVGHTYVVWDDDLFFAKLRVESFGANSVNFRWAFQLDADNPELVLPKHEAEKPIHINYNAKRSTTNVQ